MWFVPEDLVKRARTTYVHAYIVKFSYYYGAPFPPLSVCLMYVLRGKKKSIDCIHM